MKKNIFLFCCFLFYSISIVKSQQYTPLFNGKNLDGWYIFLTGKLVDQDPDSTFTVQDSMIHASGKDFGYISTKNSYKNFHLSLEFKWGQKNHPPWENAKRDGGILYYFTEG